MMMDLEILKQQINAESGYMSMNGIQVTELDKGFCQCRAPLGPEKNNPHGIAHGGFLFTVCDSAAGIAGTTLGRKVVGRSADIHFLHPGLCQVELLDEQERLIAAGSFELYFLGALAQGE